MSTREEWLMQAVEEMRPWFDKVDAPLPDRVRVSVGYSKRAGKAVGWCWVDAASRDKRNQLFISPELDNPVDVLAVLLHELAHAADNCKSGHSGEFRRIATSLGLEGKMTSTKPGEELAAKLVSLLRLLGEYPHAALTPSAARGAPKQTTRMLKVFCPNTEYTARTTNKWLTAYGPPWCPCCESPMELEGK